MPGVKVDTIVVQIDTVKLGTGANVLFLSCAKEKRGICDDDDAGKNIAVVPDCF